MEQQNKEQSTELPLLPAITVGNKTAIAEDEVVIWSSSQVPLGDARRRRNHRRRCVCAVLWVVTMLAGVVAAVLLYEIISTPEPAMVLENRNDYLERLVSLERVTAKIQTMTTDASASSTKSISTTSTIGFFVPYTGTVPPLDKADIDYEMYDHSYRNALGREDDDRSKGTELSRGQRGAEAVTAGGRRRARDVFRGQSPRNTIGDVSHNDSKPKSESLTIQSSMPYNEVTVNVDNKSTSTRSPALNSQFLHMNDYLVDSGLYFTSLFTEEAIRTEGTDIDEGLEPTQMPAQSPRLSSMETDLRETGQNVMPSLRGSTRRATEKSGGSRATSPKFRFKTVGTSVTSGLDSTSERVYFATLNSLDSSTRTIESERTSNSTLKSQYSSIGKETKARASETKTTLSPAPLASTTINAEGLVFENAIRAPPLSTPGAEVGHSTVSNLARRTEVSSTEDGLSLVRLVIQNILTSRKTSRSPTQSKHDLRSTSSARSHQQTTVSSWTTGSIAERLLTASEQPAGQEVQPTSGQPMGEQRPPFEQPSREPTPTSEQPPREPTPKSEQPIEEQTLTLEQRKGEPSRASDQPPREPTPTSEQPPREPTSTSEQPTGEQTLTLEQPTGESSSASEQPPREPTSTSEHPPGETPTYEQPAGRPRPATIIVNGAELAQRSASTTEVTPEHTETSDGTTKSMKTTSKEAGNVTITTAPVAKQRITGRKKLVTNPCFRTWIHWKGSCYKPFSSPVVWNYAKRFCQRRRADIASVHSVEENDFLISQFGPVCYRGRCRAIVGLHIGLTDSAREGHFIWSDGRAVDFLNWDRGQPSNSPPPYGDRNGEDCTEIRVLSGFGKWNDISCTSVKRPFVCKAPAYEHQRRFKR